MTELKAIETVYRGYRFRSRLEARWAVFFDAVGIRYGYEVEGFDLDGLRYLPDFWLPDQRLWVEIKGGEITEVQFSKPYQLAQQGRRNILLQFDLPIFTEHSWPNGRTMMPCERWMIFGHTNSVLFVGDHTAFNDTELAWIVGKENFYDLEAFLAEKQQEGCPFPKGAPEYDESEESARLLIEADRFYYLHRYGKEHPKWKWGHSHKGIGFRASHIASEMLCDYDIAPLLDSETIGAFDAARSARFEFGECGARTR